MGLETNCQLRLGRSSFAGRAHVDSLAFTFRGETRLDVPLSTVRAAKTGRDGALVVQHGSGEFALALGSDTLAAKWADKLLHPPSLCDKLGLKPGQRIAILGVDDAAFIRDVTARVGAPPLAGATKDLDVILFATETPAALAQLPALKKRLQSAGALWIVARKGKAATVKDAEIRLAARQAGLVDNKTCSFSDTHTALRLVIPLAAR